MSRGTARIRVWPGHQQLYTVNSEPLVIQTSLLSESDKSVQISESNQKQPSCKKRSAALEKAMVKKDVKSKVAAKKWL